MKKKEGSQPLVNGVCQWVLGNCMDKNLGVGSLIRLTELLIESGRNGDWESVGISDNSDGGGPRTLV